MNAFRETLGDREKFGKYKWSTLSRAINYGIGYKTMTKDIVYVYKQQIGNLLQEGVINRIQADRKYKQLTKYLEDVLSEKDVDLASKIDEKAKKESLKEKRKKKRDKKNDEVKK